jgi:hypothetical protein
MSEQDFEETMRETSEVTGPVSRERANRFYDRMREHPPLSRNKGSVAGTTGEYLLCAGRVRAVVAPGQRQPREREEQSDARQRTRVLHLPLDIMPEDSSGRSDTSTISCSACICSTRCSKTPTSPSCANMERA